MRRRHVLLTLGACAPIASPALIPQARAQRGYPDKPVRIVVAFAAGGPTDVMTRRLAERLTHRLGQPFVVENRTGNAGGIGSAEVARARPDGYSLLTAVSSSHAILPTLMARPAFDPLADFAGVAVLGVVPMAVAVHPSFPARNFQEFLAVVRRQPNHFTYGSSGVGGISHFTAELLMREAQGVTLTQVPYRGASAALQDLIAGQVPMVMDTLASVVPAQVAGQVRILATFAERRLASLPDTPTAIEEGLPGMVANTYNALLAPAGTPPEILQALNTATKQALAEPGFQEFMHANSIDPRPDTTPENTMAYIRSELDKWRPVIQATGMRIE
jgi:tripartite-type tricarboxylate transporter receptor subunit TctC